MKRFKALIHRLGCTHGRENVECKVVAKNVFLESVVVMMVYVEPHITIVVKNHVRINVQARSQKDDADGKLVAQDVLLDSVVITMGRCGWQADGALCPNGMCCDKAGWCGSTWNHCVPKYCQRHCYPSPSPPPPPSPPSPSPSPPPPSPLPPSPPPPSPPPSSPPPPSPPPPSPPPPSPPPPPYPRCGREGGGGKCNSDECCSIWSWCGTTSRYAKRL
ncbi:hypothetical protein R3W88_009872 [Solanum pinnatisectum]|uniref:Chitin-binding type-1 domain-containing protein n=1 Tax=Solanum pinnatisectum TaxID=50273 RepID=A0AAV9MC38_9SOLN|nr:hypothetical protein R3W88_009872 [Solanum pinnatisectum]